MSPPALPSALITVHLSAPTRGGLLVTTVPRALREVSRPRPCPTRTRSPKSSSPSLLNPSLRHCQLAMGCMLTILWTVPSNNHSSRQIGTRIQMLLVKERLPSPPKIRSVDTMVQHPKCTTTTPTLPTVDRMVVWWTCHSNQRASPLWGCLLAGWILYRIILRTVTRRIQPRAICGTMQGRSYRILRCRSRSRTSKTRTWGNSCTWMGNRPSKRSRGMVDGFVNVRK